MYILQGLILTYTNFTSTKTKQWSKVKCDIFTMIEVFFQGLKGDIFVRTKKKFKQDFMISGLSLIYIVNIFTHS